METLFLALKSGSSVYFLFRVDSMLNASMKSLKNTTERFRIAFTAKVGKN